MALNSLELPVVSGIICFLLVALLQTITIIWSNYCNPFEILHGLFAIKMTYVNVNNMKEAIKSFRMILLVDIFFILFNILQQ